MFKHYNENRTPAKLFFSEFFVIHFSKPLRPLVFRYSLLKNRLYVTVKSFKDLVSPDPASKTNPLVRLYLLPDRSKRTRRVTKEELTINMAFEKNCHVKLS